MKKSKKPVTHNLIFIGEDFYSKSCTIMSSVYEKHHKHYSRFSWAEVQLALANGDQIKIRPATASELKYFHKQLEDILIRNDS